MMTRFLAIAVIALDISAAGCADITSDGLACTTQYPCPSPLACDTTGHCVEACPSGETACNGTCYPTLNVSAVGCGNISSEGLVCTEQSPCPSPLACDNTGHCVETCPSGETACNGACVNRQTDIDNCGTCGNVCPGEACQYWASMGLGFTSSDDCVNWVNQVCENSGAANQAACVASGDPMNAGQCSQGMCVQAVDSAGVDCGTVGTNCPEPTSSYCVDGDCTAADCSVEGTYFCFAGQCNGANLQCACFQC